jgi:hypothetical protein
VLRSFIFADGLRIFLRGDVLVADKLREMGKSPKAGQCGVGPVL